MRLLQPSSPQPFLFPSCPVFTAAIFSAANFVHFMSRVFCSRLHRRLFFHFMSRVFCSRLHCSNFVHFMSRVYCSRLHRSHFFHFMSRVFCSCLHRRLFSLTSCHAFTAAVFTAAIFVHFMSCVYCSHLLRSHFCSLHVMRLLQPSSPQPFFHFMPRVFCSRLHRSHFVHFMPRVFGNRFVSIGSDHLSAASFHCSHLSLLLF